MDFLIVFFFFFVLHDSFSLFIRCAVISNAKPGSTHTFDCKGMEGRYVNIVIPGKKEFLSLCEVEVTGQFSQKPASTGRYNSILL